MKTLDASHRLTIVLALAWLLGGVLPVRAAEDFAFFEGKIRPLLVEHCYKCHSAEAKKLKANLLLDTKAGLLKGGETGPALVAGDIENSLLIKAVRYKDAELQMPPAGKLSDAQIADLETWVKMGAPDSRLTAPAAKAAENDKDAGGIDFAEGRKWWAFQPVQDPAPPAVKGNDWAKSDIDRFILARLEAQGLSPAPAADKRTLIRRAYYDLVGLPPTPEEVDAFLADASPEAFAKVVDHLLALPQYGERWGRHWLDVVRYVDALDSRRIADKDDISFAWRYRDWVVKSLNNDMPYDQFLKYQIAGDLLPDVEPDRMNKDGLVATSVYAIGDWGFGDADKEKILTDVVDDQIDLTGRAFLGLTLACARCHDHKFDPISNRDYYGLAGIFFSSHVLPGMADKSLGQPTQRVALIDKPEQEKRDADAARLTELGGEIDGVIDTQLTQLAEEMLPKIDQYIAAAWEYKKLDAAARPPVQKFAQDRNLQGYALGQWLNYVGTPTFKLMPKPIQSPGGFAGVDGWTNADDVGTPVVWANNNDKPIQLATITLPPHSINMHPPATAGIAVAWRSPTAGRVKITGSVHDADATAGDGITWSLSHLGAAAAGEVASGTLANGGMQPFADGTGGTALDEIRVDMDEMIQLTILPKAEYTCDTTTVELQITELDGAKRTWDLSREVVPSLHQGNPHADAFGNERVWHFHDTTGQAQAVFAAGSAMSKFAVSVAAAGNAGAELGSVRAAADDVRKTVQAVGAEVAKLKSEGKDVAAMASPDALFYQTITAPRGPFWSPARADESNLPAEGRQDVAAMRSEMDVIRQALAQPIPMAHAMQEGGTPGSMFTGIQDVPIHVRGSYTRLGEVVPRHLPTVLAGENQPPITQGSGRKELAAWVANADNPLTARVMVNRIWQHHFVEGIVETANNFGKLGTPPTHPELLDYLAARFVKSGWSVKAMHRAVMLSAVYQQSSETDAAEIAADPGNHLLGRMNRRRLDAESLRDGCLAVTGRLDKTQGGPAINDPMMVRRTLYLMTIRSDRSTYRALFDAADASAIVEQRINSTVAPQALFMMNSPFILTHTQFLAQRVLKEGGDTDEAKITWLYRQMFSRPPTDEEVEIGKRALARAREPQPGETVSPDLPWDAYCQVLLCSNEFIYVD